MGEPHFVSALEMILFPQFFEGCLKTRHDELRKSKEVTRLGDVHRAQFARPGIDVFENVMVNGLKMLRVEPARQGPERQLEKPTTGSFRLKLVQSIWISDVPKIFKDVRSRVNVRVHISYRRNHRRRDPALQSSFRH